MNRATKSQPGGFAPDPARARLTQAAGELVRDRLRFAAPFLVVGLGSFLILTGLAGFTSALTGYWVGPFSLLSVLVMAYLPAVGIVSLLYSRRARLWDEKAAALVNDLVREIAL